MLILAFFGALPLLQAFVCDCQIAHSPVFLAWL